MNHPDNFSQSAFNRFWRQNGSNTDTLGILRRKLARLDALPDDEKNSRTEWERGCAEAQIQQLERTRHRRRLTA